MSTFDQRGQRVATQHNVAGDARQGDEFNFSGATITGSNFNLKSRLEHVTQSVGAGEDSARLSRLLEQLDEMLKAAPAEQAETVSTFTEQTVNAAKSGNASLLKISAKGLTEAAGALVGIAPGVVTVVREILGLLGEVEK